MIQAFPAPYLEHRIDNDYFTQVLQVECVGKNRRVKFYWLTRTGQQQLLKEEEEWNRASAIVTRFLTRAEENNGTGNL